MTATATATATAITVPVVIGTRAARPLPSSTPFPATSAPEAAVVPTADPEAGRGDIEVRPSTGQPMTRGAVDRPAGGGRAIEAPGPVSRRVPETGSGTFHVAAAVTRPSAAATTYRVEVEKELLLDVDEMADFVDQTLDDPRSWSSTHPLVRVAGPADLRIVIATPETTDQLCAPLDTDGRLSCRNGSDVVLNGWRWQHGADSYGEDITNYRRYLINHETGHALGYGHVDCPGEGAAAPVMLQQTKGLAGCRPNPWPGPVDLSGS